MNYAEICIIKRDGKREDFSISKIKNAISKAFSATGIQDEQQLIADITMNVISQFATPTITVEEIHDLVEKAYHVHKEGDYHVLKGVVSRKKQLIPMFMSAMQEQ